jgi:hypothetical protein
VEIASLCVPPVGVAGKENRSVYAQEGPLCVPIQAGCYKLNQAFAIHAVQAKGSLPGHPATAEFAPSPALDPVWIVYKDPFHGVNKKDFGFQVILKVVPAEPTGPEHEVLAAPTLLGD